MLNICEFNLIYSNPSVFEGSFLKFQNYEHDSNITRVLILISFYEYFQSLEEDEDDFLRKRRILLFSY